MPAAAFVHYANYGPAAAAAIVTMAPDVAGGVTGQARAQASTTGAASVPLAKPTRLRNRPATLAASAAITSALPKGRARPTAVIEVNKLSQDDVTGAVLEAQVEPGVTLRDAIRVLAAVAAGKTTITPTGGSTAEVKFRNLGDTADIVTADMDGSERVTVVLDL